MRTDEPLISKPVISNAKKFLNWKPKYDLDTLCMDMLLNDLKLYGMSLEEAKKIAKRLK